MPYLSAASGAGITLGLFDFGLGMPRTLEVLQVRRGRIGGTIVPPGAATRECDAIPNVSALGDGRIDGRNAATRWKGHGVFDRLV